MNKKTKSIVSLICCAILCFIGVNEIIVESPRFINVFLAIAGFIGLVGGIYELKRQNAN